MLDKITKLDKLILAAAIAMLLILYYVFWVGSGTAQQVVVMVAGEKRYVYDLNENRIFDVQGKLGISKLEILNGRVRFLESPCTTKFCIRSGWLTSAGGFTACLPNGVSVQLVGSKPRFDAINF